MTPHGDISGSSLVMACCLTVPTHYLKEKGPWWGSPALGRWWILCRLQHSLMIYLINRCICRYTRTAASSFSIADLSSRETGLRCSPVQWAHYLSSHQLRGGRPRTNTSNPAGNHTTSISQMIFNFLRFLRVSDMLDIVKHKWKFRARHIPKFLLSWPTRFVIFRNRLYRIQKKSCV